MEKELNEYEFWQDIEKDNKQSLFALNKENIELKAKINKVIEYIKDNKWEFVTEFGYVTDYEVVKANDLLKILGDKENE